MFNSSLADQLSKLQLQPQNFVPRAEAQRPRCICHNQYLDRCPTNQPTESKAVSGARKAKVSK